MKSKLVDTCAYAGNGVVDTKGADSCLVIFKGIGEIKVQHCDTNNGDFEDYETIGDFDENVNIGVFVNLEGAKKYIKVVGADIYSIVLGDMKVDPSTISASGNIVGKLYAYTYKDSEDDCLIYTDKLVTDKGTITIYTPEADTTYNYVLTKDTLKIESVASDGKITDDSDVVYTPVENEDIEL